MKAIYCLVLTLLSALCFSQENSEKIEASPESFKLYYYAPIPFGNNMLSKAHTNDFNGFGISVRLFRIRQVHVNIAFENVGFSATDVSMAGNIEASKLTNFILEGMYKVPLTGRITVNPKIGIGAAQIRQSGNGQDFGKQPGISFNLGGEVDYKIVGRFRAFAGVGYSYMRMRIDTAPELESFYGNVHTLNLLIGLKI